MCDSNGKSDPYVKATYAVVAGDGRNAASSRRASLMKIAKPKESYLWKGKTKVCHKTLDPEWNETFELCGACSPPVTER